MISNFVTFPLIFVGGGLAMWGEKLAKAKEERVLGHEKE